MSGKSRQRVGLAMKSGCELLFNAIWRFLPETTEADSRAKQLGRNTTSAAVSGCDRIQMRGAVASS